MNVYIVLGLVVISLFCHVRICGAGRKGSGSRDDLRPQVDDEGQGLGSCQARGRGGRTLKNRIIRTKDSIDNGACFANAITVASINECNDRCCSYSGSDCNAKCDTSIFVDETSDDEVNCFLFVCGENDYCKFSYHSGYTTTQLSSHRGRIEEPPLTTNVATTRAANRPSTTQILSTTTSKVWPTTTATWELPTTQTIKNGPQHEPKQNEEPDVFNDDMPEDCKRFEFQCGSGECYRFSYVCDGIIDCRDNSDETGCDYATTADTIVTTSAPLIRVQPTDQNIDNNVNVHLTAAGSASQEAASESKNDFPSKHGEKNPEGSNGMVGNVASKGSVPDSDDHDGYKEHDNGLTQELQNKGHERVNDPEENQMSLTDLQNDLHALSGSGNEVIRNGKDQENVYEKETDQKAGENSREYDKNEDYDRGGDRLWSYDEGTDNHHLAEDLHGTKYGSKHTVNDEDSLKDVEKSKEDKYEDERKPNDEYMKEDATNILRDDSSSLQHDIYNHDDVLYNHDDGRPVYEAVGRKLDNVEKLPHTRKNGHQMQKDYKENKHQVSDHTDRFEDSQKSGHKASGPDKWQGDRGKDEWDDRAKDNWDGRSYASENVEPDDTGKALVRDKGDKWLHPPPKYDSRGDDNRDHLDNRDHEDTHPDNQWHKDVNSRNRNHGWKTHEGRQQNDEEEYDRDRNIPSQNYIGRWQDRQRRPEPAPNRLSKYHHNQAPNWYDHQDRRPEYRDYEYIGRGENPHQFWNQYKNKQPHRQGGNRPTDSYEQYSVNEYDNVASFDEDHEEVDETSTTVSPHHDNEVEESTTSSPTTTIKAVENTSDESVIQMSGNVTETPKKTFSNSNKSSSVHKTLFKKKSSLPDKSLTSAILPLAFGLLITALLLLLVGCRLRQVNRRLRYGRLKTNVAEADYLINGMYL